MKGRPVPTPKDPLPVWLDYLGQIHVTGIDLGLERLQPVAEHLRLLQVEVPVVTVAGTNGKGSTSMTVASIYQAAGEKVGLYQSPHVHRFNERIRISGEEASDDLIVAALVQVERARQACGLSLSFFESTTLAAWLIFKQQGCTVWVLEVGLGGRLDAVNLIDPDVAVITNIGLDHTQWLGDSIEQIATEKAGIMRPGIAVVYGDQESCPQAIVDQAAALGANLMQAGQSYGFVSTPQGVLYSGAAVSLHLPRPRLAAVNVAAAVTAVLAGPIAVTAADIQAGVATATLPGRMQVLRVQGRTVVLDVAHNAHGMRFLRKQLTAQGMLGADRPLRVVFSMLDDKDVAAVVAVMADCVQRWYIAGMDTPRAAALAQLQQALQPVQQTHGPQAVQSFADLPAALTQALADSQGDDVVLACGSFHVLEALQPVLDGANT